MAETVSTTQTIDTLTLLVAQTNTSDRYQPNIETVARLARRAAENNCDMLCLPEASGLMNKDASAARKLIGCEESDPYLSACRSAAVENNIWIHNGSTPVLGDDNKLFNRTHLINSQGIVVARYDKIHLFDIYLPDGKDRLESKRYAPGFQSVVVNTPWGLMGLSICYDLRFPMIYRQYAQAGTRLIFIPSAFNCKTGEAHWETLLRARAIENASFIVAAAQTGLHDDGRKTYGHSLVVNPWGSVLADLGTNISAEVVKLNLSEADEMRKQIPSLNHSKDYQQVTLPVC